MHVAPTLLPWYMYIMRVWQCPNSLPNTKPYMSAVSRDFVLSSLVSATPRLPPFASAGLSLLFLWRCRDGGFLGPKSHLLSGEAKVYLSSAKMRWHSREYLRRHTLPDLLILPILRLTLCYHVLPAFGPASHHLRSRIHQQSQGHSQSHRFARYHAFPGTLLRHHGSPLAVGRVSRSP
jgi:hypothetical protein